MNYKIILFFILSKICIAHSPLPFIYHYIKPQDLIFDVGAHFGNKTERYLSYCARVVCFDPQPICISTLKNKFGNSDRVIIEECGLSDKENILTFYVASNATAVSTFSLDWTQHGRFNENGFIWDQAIQIPVKTLDAMIEKYGLPKFCKIDVENFEYNVLQGLTKPIPYISFEFCKEYLNQTEKCIRYLQNLGYKGFNVSFAETDFYLFNYWMEADALIMVLKECSDHDMYIRDCWGLWGDVYAAYDLE